MVFFAITTLLAMVVLLVVDGFRCRKEINKLRTHNMGLRRHIAATWAGERARFDANCGPDKIYIMQDDGSQYL